MDENPSLSAWSIKHYQRVKGDSEIKYPMPLQVPPDKYLHELPKSAFVATSYLQLSNSLLICRSTHD
jgi:hypothetical protein